METTEPRSEREQPEKTLRISSYARATIFLHFALLILLRFIAIFFCILFLLCLFYEVIAIKHFFVVSLLRSAYHRGLGAICLAPPLSLPVPPPSFSCFSLIVINPKWLFAVLHVSLFFLLWPEIAMPKKKRRQQARTRRKASSVCFGNEFAFAASFFRSFFSTTKPLKGIIMAPFKHVILLPT